MPDPRALRVVVSITGSVAAYKACEIVTLLRKSGADVRVIMTKNALQFISPTTLQSLSGHPVTTSIWETHGEAEHGMAHLDLGSWADVHIVAPASANAIARIALGLADDPTTATILASSAQLIIAPAMEEAMWTNPATQGHIATLQQRGADIIGPESGRLASGKEAIGRMAEPGDIVAAAQGGNDHAILSGVHILITAGGTREPIDPVRYIGNRSSGKMGRALVAEALRQGAVVTVITTVDLGIAHRRLDTVFVETAEEMKRALEARFADIDILIMAAAVADFRPTDYSPQKIKKGNGPTAISMTATSDIIGNLRLRPDRGNVMIVGFAAETSDLVRNGAAKLHDKGLDLIIANDVSRSDIGMSADNNEVTVIFRDGTTQFLDKASKNDIAKQILAVVQSQFMQRGPRRVA